MPQSLSKVIVHVIFSTKDREPWLGSEVRARMHAYLATVCRDLGAEFVHVGGVADHVHIVTEKQTLTFILSLWQRERRGPHSVCRVSQRELHRTRRCREPFPKLNLAGR